MRSLDRHVAWRHGFARGLVIALILLAAVPFPGLSGSGYVWNLAMGSGVAALVMLSAMTWSGGAADSASLPAAFLHAGHVYAARVAVAFALVHAVVLVVEEPALLAEFRPDGPYAMQAGGAALMVLALLATTPRQRCRPIHERYLVGTGHAALAVVAGVLMLVHLLAVDYAGVNWRRWILGALAAAAIVATIRRRALRRTAGTARPVHQSEPMARSFARAAALLLALMISAAVLVYAAAA